MSSRNFVPIKEGNNVIFYLNTGGFPLSNDVWNQMWTYAKELQPSAVEKVQKIQTNQEKIPEVEAPTPPHVHLANKSLSNVEKLEKIQEFIEKLQYNHTGLQFFEVRKDRPLMGLAELSKKMIEDSLPIKCLEAVILSIYFINEIVSSNSLSGVEKFTIGFKTMSKGNVHRHVVLGVYCHSSGFFGALGISRRSDLGSKKLEHGSLTELISDYINSYSGYLHKVKRIKIGMPIPNSNRSFETIPWNGCTINLKENKEWSKLVEKHSRSIRHFNSMFNSKPGLTSLNLKTTSKVSTLNQPVRNSSYLNKHLDKIKFNSVQKLPVKLDKSEIMVCFDDDEEEEEISDKENFRSTSLGKLNLDASNESITLIGGIQKSSNLNKIIQISDNTYSAGLVKRKQSSLRV